MKIRWSSFLEWPWSPEMVALRYGSTDISSLCMLIGDAFIILTYFYLFAAGKVCGHRWKSRGFNSGANRYVQGKCLVSGRLLRDFHVVLPCTQGEDSSVWHRCVQVMNACYSRTMLLSCFALSLMYIEALYYV